MQGIQIIAPCQQQLGASTAQCAVSPVRRQPSAAPSAAPRRLDSPVRPQPIASAPSPPHRLRLALKLNPSPRRDLAGVLASYGLTNT
jgi:hypothetical protein